mmetsp:Transcript_1493/g.2467  ORF Transcript_1493/g.2467 Transcript_1493/m.2467 type:complete len:961 (-) Transcript_1493:336-3218(-)
MIKGPKAILSSAISNALSEYFIIDPSTNIESNLLHDAKIVLRHVQLKPQRSIIPLGANDNDDDNGFTDTATTIATTTGSVDKVVFSWTWSVGYGSGGDTGEWIRDALLLIEGAKFECCLEKHDYFNVQPTDIINNDNDSKTASLSSSFVNPTTIDDKSAKTIKSTPGGISGFVSRQIEMVIDNLTLRMVDFELKIIVAVSSPPPSGGVASSVGKGSATTTRSFLIGVDQVELLSFGRKTTTIASGDGMATTALLKQRINLRSFRSSILIGSSKEDEGSSTAMKSGIEGDDSNVQNLINELAFLPTNISSVGGKEELDSKSEVDANNNNSNVKEDEYHLMEPFSYSADVTRMGSRFSGLMNGVEVVGIVPSSVDDEDDNGAGGIAVHMGKTQVESLVLLGEMILAPSTPSSSSNSEESTEGATSTSPSPVLVSIEESEIKPNVAASEKDPSSFILPLSFATLVADDKKFSVSAISMKYKADGTICQFDAKKVCYESIDGGRAEASNIYASMRPAVKIIIDSIDTLHIPGVALLEKPVEFTELKYEGNTLTARFHKIELITFGKEQDSAPGGSPTNTTKQPAKVSSISKSEVGHKHEPASASANAITAPKLPFSVDVSVKGCHIKKSADGSSMEMTNFQLFCNENKVGNSSDIALNIGHFKNHLASVSDVYLCASFPFDAVNCINALNLSVGDATILSGHSVEDWQESFQSKYRSEAKLSSSAPFPVIKLPNAAIADMKLAILLKTNVGVKVKQTPLTIKAFNGKDATTSKDVINYYTMACLSRVPEFISNAEVLGLNVVDNTAATWGNFVGLATPFGGFTGLAAVVGVDAVKNTVSAGKRGRGKSEGDNYEASDVARGLFQAAKEATNRGATMRGKKDHKGNVIDWAVGATTTTTEYVGENKTRLGGAAAGGGGFMVGMVLGGPVGAIIGGLVATAATGKTLETIDEHQKKKIEQPKLTNE